jgi:hypothetical protein
MKHIKLLLLGYLLTFSSISYGQQTIYKVFMDMGGKFTNETNRASFQYGNQVFYLQSELTDRITFSSL